MSAIDWTLLVIVAVSALFGAMRGFVGVVASIAGWLLAGWAALQFGATVAVLLSGGHDPSLGQLFAGYALSFVGVLVVVALIAWVARKLLQAVGLTVVDRAMGFGLGIARGMLVGAVVVLLLGLTAIPREPSWQSSAIVPIFKPVARWLRGWLPEWVAERVDLGDGAAAAVEPPSPLPDLPAPAMERVPG
ncbi:MAG TPA: CvpA family protein [Lysobacter sp.]|nr:CvpA family protein [Lysobacter sp.]